MQTPRIYADFNGMVDSFRTPGRTAVVLDTFGTFRDLMNARIALSNGLKLVVYDCSDYDEDLEADVTAYFDGERKQWVAEFDASGYRYVPAKTRDHSLEVHCWSCRRELPASIREKGFWLDAHCPHCNAEISDPLKNPEI